MGDTQEASANSVDLVGLASDIVSAYLSRNRIPVSELPALLRNVHASLVGIGRPAEPEPTKLTPPVPIRKTVTPEHIISLEDGRPYRALKRHLSGRGMTPEQYRTKWGLPPDYPMVAPNYAAQRSELAKSLGLGNNRRKAAAEKRADPDAKVSAPAEPKKSRGRPRKAAASE